MAVITGQRTTGNISSDQRVIDMSKDIDLLEGDAAPLTRILKMAPKEKATDTLFKWLQDDREDRWDAINNGAGYNNSATSIVVDDGTVFAAEDLVKVPRTGEVFSVTSISTNTLTVVRGIGSSAAAIVDDDPLYVIGTAAEEGDTSPSPRTYNPTTVTNYTQIFRNTVAASGSELSSSTITTKHDWEHQQSKVHIEHLIDIENALLFGKPATTTGADGGPRRMTGGILHYATANNQDAGGTLTEAEWETWNRSIFRYGSGSRLILVSRLVASVLNQFAVGKLQTMQGAKSYGLNIQEYITTNGTSKIVVDDLLEGATYGGYAIALDVKSGAVKYRFLNGDGPGGSRDTKLHTNVQERDRDGRRDEYITECGLQAGHASRNGVLYGVTG
jgi:hypothetical protein